MKLFTALLALPLPLALAQGSLGVEGPNPFVGKGIVGMYHNDDGQYLGCMTVGGQWTADNTQCAVVTGTEVNGGEEVQFSTSAGGCETNLDLVCGQGTGAYERIALAYGTRIFFGDLYLTYTASPAVKPTGKQVDTIHIYYDTDSGPFVMLGWNATSS